MGADVKVDLDLVILKSDEGKGKTGVAAIPELKRDVKSRLRKGITRSANLARGIGITGSVNIVERRIRDEGELSGVTNHLVVTTLLLRSEGELSPDVHPVTILAINALASDLYLNLRDHLLTLSLIHI